MKIASPIEEKKARIEIIPLIDIMFFLLACFMAVSLSMVQMRGMKVNLPSAVSTQPELRQDFTSVTVDAAGIVYLEKEQIEKTELTRRIKALYGENPDLRVYIRADKDTLHGDVVGVLDLVRAAGVQKVAFEMRVQTVGSPGQTSGAPDRAAPAATPGSSPAASSPSSVATRSALTPVPSLPPPPAPVSPPVVPAPPAAPPPAPPP